MTGSMTVIGHILTGTAIGVVCMPRRWSVPAKAMLIGVFVLLADLPDIAHLVGLPKGPTHSLLLNALAAGILVAAPALWPSGRRRLGGWIVTIGAAVALLSHLLLDSFYNHRQGVHVDWPFGGYRLNLAMPWFEPIRGGWPAHPHAGRIAAYELIAYGSLLAVCVLGRWLVLRRRQRG